MFLPVQKVFLPGRAAKSGKNLAKMVITGKNWQKVFLGFYSKINYFIDIILSASEKEIIFIFRSTFVGHFLTFLPQLRTIS